MNSIHIFLKALQDGVILSPSSFKYLNCEEVLLGRDDPNFERQWLQLFEGVGNVSLSDTESKDLNVLRETAFKTVFRNSNNEDLAAYVSDDIEVIVKGIKSNADNEFLVDLLAYYCDGKIPYGEIKRSNLSLQSLLDSLNC